jgi:hypothetical protein
MDWPWSEARKTARKIINALGSFPHEEAAMKWLP